MKLKYPILVAVILFSVGCKYQNPTINRGYVDLTDWNFESNIMDLNGQWEFYWGQLLTPDDFAHRYIKPEYITVPNAWNKGRLNGQKLDRHGCATYRARIAMPPGRYALYCNKVETAYTIWINGKKIHTVGRPGATRAAADPRYSNTIEHFYNHQKIAEVIIQVSNFRHYQSGIVRPVKIGATGPISSHYALTRAVNFSIATAFLIITIYNLTIYILRNEDKSTLYFALFCASFVVYFLILLEKLHTAIHPAINWELQLKILYFSFMFTPAMYLLYLKELFAEESKPAIIKIICAITCIIGLIVLLAKSYHYAQITGLLYLLMILSVIYSFIILAKAVVRRRPGSISQAAPCAVFFITVVNDLLFSSGAINTMRLAPMGIMFFVAWQFVLIARKYAYLMRRTQQLSDAHEGANKKLVALLKGCDIEMSKIFANLNDILFIKSQGHFCQIYTIGYKEQTPIELNMKIGKIPASIGGTQLIDVHRSYLVNRDKIKYIQRVSDNKYEAVFNDTPAIVPVARQKAIDLKKSSPNLFK